MNVACVFQQVEIVLEDVSLHHQVKETNRYIHVHVHVDDCMTSGNVCRGRFCLVSCELCLAFGYSVCVCVCCVCVCVCVCACVSGEESFI